jgi:hypothetical protein
MDDLLHEHLETLDSLLGRLIELQTELLGALHAKRDAIRHADGDAIVDAARREDALAQELRNADAQRLRVVAAIAQHLFPPRATTPTITEIAEALEDPIGQRLLERAVALRSLIEQATEQNAVLREATDRLGLHLRGLVSLIHTAMDRARTYNRTGAMHNGAQLSTGLDITS